MDFFLLKKLLGTLLMPLSIAIISALIAFFFFHLKPKLARFCIGLAVTILFLLGLKPVSSSLSDPLETAYPVYEKQPIKVNYIVVLGCVGRVAPKLPPTSQLKSCALERLIESIRIFKLHPEAMLITTGYGIENEIPHAELMKQAAMALGVPESKILTEPFVKDTEDEAQIVSARVGKQQAILVTSANHMPRAMRLFERFGMSPIAAPASPKARVVANKNWAYWVPTVQNIEQATRAWYELLGSFWHWIKHDVF